MEDEEDFDLETPDYDFEETIRPGLMAAESLSIAPPASVGVADVYSRVAERLRSQRAGLSGKEKLGALLLGFGQPTRRGGNWKDSVANAAQSLAGYSMKARDRDLKREELIAKYETEGAYKSAMAQAAADRAAKTGAGSDKLNAEKQRRMMYALKFFPDKTEQQILDENLLVSEEVEDAMISFAQANQGYMTAAERQAQVFGSRKPVPAATVAVPPAAIQFLRANPNQAAAFKAKYGVDPEVYLKGGS